MNPKLRSFSQRYLDALRNLLETGPSASHNPAQDLGQEAVALGLRPMELERIHETALERLNASQMGRERSMQAEAFFKDAGNPLREGLNQRTLELLAENRQLHREVIRAKNVETSLKKSEVRSEKLLQEALKLQEGLRKLTHQALIQQEEERMKISHELQDEIAQTLLAINVRLICLKQLAQDKNSEIKNAIASAQQLIVTSAASVRRVTRKLQKP